MPAKQPLSTMGVGIDVERVVRFRKIARTSRLFFSRTLTDAEREYCMSKADPYPHFAGFFAAKEAAYKAAGGLSKARLSMTKFEVVHGRDGAPRIKYNGTEPEPKLVVKISISHTTEEAAAIALALIPGALIAPGHE